MDLLQNGLAEPSAIDLRGVSGSLIALYKDFCAKYMDISNTN